jgi:hypothetical protein
MLVDFLIVDYIGCQKNVPFKANGHVCGAELKRKVKMTTTLRVVDGWPWSQYPP